MSKLLKAWYVFVGLGLLTFILTSFVGPAPLALSSAVALPNNLFFRAGANVRRTMTRVLDRHDLHAQVARLEEQLAAANDRSRRLQLELEHYQQALSIRQAQSPGVVASAPVIGLASSDLSARLELGIGSAEGARINMPVTVPAGLVGIVTAVTPRSASVRLITDPQSRVGVTVRTRGGEGIAEGAMGGLIRVEDYYQKDSVEVGDEVETSSRGGLFPRGILVGKVVQVFPQNPNSLRMAFLVAPAVDIPDLQEVALIAPL